jgi:DNA primase
VSGGWDDIKRTPIDTVASALGIAVRRHQNIRCPFPDHNDSTPSFRIYPKKNTYHCFGCGRGGSVIDLVVTIKGIEPRAAVQWLRANFCFHAADETGAASSPQARSQRTNENAPDCDLYAGFLLQNPMTSAGEKYLASRGIAVSTARHFQIGFIADGSSAVLKLVERFDEARCRAAGLLYRSGFHPRLTLPSECLLIPYTVKGEISYLQTRAIHASAKGRWRGILGVSKPLYNVDAIASAGSIYICEGVMDVLSLHEFGLTAIGLPGAATRPSAEVFHSLKGKIVYVLPDQDEAGDGMVEALVPLLRLYRIECVVQELPRGKDANEFLMRRRSGQ